MILLRLLSYIPLPLLYLFSDGLYLLFGRLLGYRGKVISKNLQLAFPEKSEAERKILQKKFYRHLCDVIVETLKTISIPREELHRRVQLDNPEEITQYFEQGQSVVVVTSHQGNWEWLLTACSDYLPFHVDAVYMQLNNPFFDELMKKIRSRFGAEMTEKKTAFRTIVQHRDKVTLTAMVADQRNRNARQSVETSFFGQNTSFYLGPERIARKLDLPMIFVDMRKVKRGHYQIGFKTVAAPPYSAEEGSMIRKYVSLMEESVRQQPEAYLWSHDRWKNKRQMPETPA
ncbi:MAG: lysophospholipid acyltransferase family protein [Cyclobacteriaceae bacterium]